MQCAECPDPALDDDFLCRKHRNATLPWYKRVLVRGPKKREKRQFFPKIREEVAENIESPLARAFFYVGILFAFVAVSCLVAACWTTWKFGVSGLILGIFSAALLALAMEISE